MCACHDWDLSNVLGIYRSVSIYIYIYIYVYIYIHIPVNPLPGVETKVYLVISLLVCWFAGLLVACLLVDWFAVMLFAVVVWLLVYWFRWSYIFNCCMGFLSSDSLKDNRESRQDTSVLYNFANQETFPRCCRGGLVLPWGQLVGGGWRASATQWTHLTVYAVIRPHACYPGGGNDVKMHHSATQVRGMT